MECEKIMNMIKPYLSEAGCKQIYEEVLTEVMIKGNTSIEKLAKREKMHD